MPKEIDIDNELEKEHEKLKEKIYEIENNYPDLHIDLHREKFKKEDINKLEKLYKKLNKLEKE